MKAYIQVDCDGIPKTEVSYTALRGFEYLGFETEKFQDAEELNGAEKESVIVGNVSLIRSRLKMLGCYKEQECYPESLKPYYGRKIWRSRVSKLREPSIWPVFVKPALQKSFCARVINTADNLHFNADTSDDTEVYCSEVVHFRSEWRAFVRYGNVVDLRHYKGNWRRYPDSGFIEECIQSFKDQPAAYGIDFGVTKDGRTLLVEVNDGYSLAPYGLDSIEYARLLAARWCELTGCDDTCPGFSPMDTLLKMFPKPGI